MEIFDVTEAGPTILVNDELGVNYTEENMLFFPSKTNRILKSRHCSGPSSFNRQRHSSDSTSNLRTFPRIRKGSMQSAHFRGIE